MAAHPPLVYNSATGGFENLPAGDTTFPYFASLAAATASTIPTSITLIILLNYATTGDRGGGVYIHAASPGAGAGKFQSADGQWWILDATMVTPYQFGAIGDGVTDDVVAMRAALSYISGVATRSQFVLDLAGDIFAVSGPLTLPSNMVMQNGEVIAISGGVGGWITSGDFSGSQVFNPSYLTVNGSGAITGGSGATVDGTYVLGFTGAVLATNGPAALGTFTVTGGAVTAITILFGGWYTTAPTGFDFTSCGGLSGASATPTSVSIQYTLATWVVGATGNAVLTIGSGVFNIALTNLTVDCGSTYGGTQIANVQGIYVAATSGIVPINVTVQHWGTTGGNGVIIDAGKIQAFRLVAQQYVTSDYGFNLLPARRGCGIGFINGAADSTIQGGHAAYTQYPLFVDQLSHHIGFIGFHPYNGGSGVTITNPANCLFMGYALNIADWEIDNGQIIFYITTNSRLTPNFTITGGRYIQNDSNSMLDSWIRLLTNQAGSNIVGLSLDDGTWSNNSRLIPEVNFGVASGSGDWLGSGTPATIVPIAALSQPTRNLRMAQSINHGSATDYLGAYSLSGYMDNAISIGAQGHTATQAESGYLYQYANSTADITVTLPNFLAKGWKAWFGATNIGATHKVTHVAASGATMLGTAAGKVTVGQGAIGWIECINNVDNVSAVFEIVFAGLKIVSKSPTTTWTLDYSDNGQVINWKNGAGTPACTINQMALLGSPQAFQASVIVHGSGAATFAVGSGVVTLNGGAGPITTTGSGDFIYFITSADGSAFSIWGKGL